VLDPEQGWLAPGITGLSRQREWDVVTTVAASGVPGDAVIFVALADGRLIEEVGAGADLEPLGEAVRGSLAPPFRASAIRHDDVWAVGASAIDVVRLDPDPDGDDLELTWDGETLALAADGIPVDVERAKALERVAAERQAGHYAARATRLEGDLFELSIHPL
jgi:hypothetical protein